MEKIINNYKAVVKNYSDFSSRSNRSEYWNFVLANLIISIGISFFSTIIGNDSNLLGSLYSLVVFLPGIAVSIRRIHDIGKNGWWLLVSLIPFIGVIWLIILLATSGNPKKNEFGPVPKKAKAK